MGFDLHGLNANPQVLGVFGTGPGAYKLSANSPAIDRGRLVTDALRGMGVQDVFGAGIPQGVTFDIGAFEYRVGQPDPAAAHLTRVLRQSNGSWQVQFAGAVGGNYLMQGSSDLRSWSQIGVVAENSPGQFNSIDRSETAARYYRAVSRSVPRL
jgi:hypothetical protein